MGLGKFEKRPQPHNSDAGKAQAKGRKTNRILLIIMIGVLVVLLALLIALAVAGNYVLGRIGRYDDQTDPAGPTEPVEIFVTDPTEPGSTVESMDPNDVTWASVDQVQSKNVINILLIGQDARPGEGRTRSDTMILLSLNKKSGAIQMTSFMRDMYVQIPGYMDNKLNAAFALEGPELLNETLTKNFGIQIDGNVEVNFEAFEAVIDILGGVDVQMDEEEAWYMQNMGHYDIEAGMNHMNGEEALDFARMRHVSGGDYTRTERQRRLITSVINSLKQSDLTTVLDLLDQVLPYMVTDLTDQEIISYTTTGLSVLAQGGQINSIRIPADDAHYGAYINEMSVLVPDLEMCQEDLKEFIYGEE